jgi:patatin-like phospholipase/acyl hydrolase
LDGGGVKGVLEARVIQRLEAAEPFLGKVDLFAGTSTGGILALALAAGVSPADCVALYRDNADAIFSSRGFLDAVTPDEYVRADYSQEGLRKVLQDVFGNKRLPELDREVLVPCFDLARFRPKFLDLSDDWSLVDAALATSAAPTYFPVHLVRESLTGRATSKGSIRALIDGGVFANNPADRAAQGPRPTGRPMRSSTKTRTASIGGSASGSSSTPTC